MQGNGVGGAIHLHLIIQGSQLSSEVTISSASPVNEDYLIKKSLQNRIPKSMGFEFGILGKKCNNLEGVNW